MMNSNKRIDFVRYHKEKIKMLDESRAKTEEMDHQNKEVMMIMNSKVLNCHS